MKNVFIAHVKRLRDSSDEVDQLMATTIRESKEILCAEDDKVQGSFINGLNINKVRGADFNFSIVLPRT